MLDRLSVDDKVAILEDTIFFDMKGIYNLCYLEGFVRQRKHHSNIFYELRDCFLDLSGKENQVLK
jgi:hypothetical protein